MMQSPTEADSCSFRQVIQFRLWKPNTLYYVQHRPLLVPEVQCASSKQLSLKYFLELYFHLRQFFTSDPSHSGFGQKKFYAFFDSRNL